MLHNFVTEKKRVGADFKSPWKRVPELSFCLKTLQDF